MEEIKFELLCAIFTLGKIHTDTTLFLGLGLPKKTQIAKIHSDGAPNICRTILRRKSHLFLHHFEHFRGIVMTDGRSGLILTWKKKNLSHQIFQPLLYRCDANNQSKKAAG